MLERPFFFFIQMHINFLAILNVQIVGVFIHVKNRSEITIHISMDNYMHGDLCPPSVRSPAKFRPANILAKFEAQNSNIMNLWIYTQSLYVYIFHVKSWLVMIKHTTTCAVLTKFSSLFSPCAFIPFNKTLIPATLRNIAFHVWSFANFFFSCAPANPIPM